MVRINLWASPRNISTAIMYSFRQRNDTIVVDEPFYAYYLAKSGELHPGREEILASQDQDFLSVFNNVIHANYSSPIVFFKQMSHHLNTSKLDHFIEDINVILIRNPEEMIISFSKVIEHPTISDLGLKSSFELLNYFKSHDKNVIVVNSDELLNHPKKYLSKWCEKLNIPFQEEMLSWPKGPKKEDGVWSPYWYSNVHKSSSFESKEKNKSTIRKDQESLLNECLDYFNELNKYTI